MNGESVCDNVVLYVEDEPVNVLLMRLLFERRPALRLEVATSGQEAQALAPQLQPRLLLLDLQLPDCHGIELLKLLRSQPGWLHLPAIAVTAQSGFSAAGTDFIEAWRKPVHLQRALARLDELLGVHPHETPLALMRAAPRAAARQPR